MPGIRLVIKVNLIKKSMPGSKGLPVPMTSLSSKALDKQFKYNGVWNWDSLSTLPVKEILFSAGRVDPSKLGHTPTILGGETKNNFTPPVEGFWGLIHLKSFPLNGYKCPTCTGRKIGEGFIPFESESGRGIHTEVAENVAY